METSSKNPLKHTLTRLFQPSTLLKSSCNSSSASSTIFTSSTNTGSTRSLSSFTTDDPRLLITGNSSGANSNSKLDHALSFSSSSRMLYLNCNACRPTKALDDDVVVVVQEKKERRMNENSEFYETGEREGRTCPHASPSSPSKNCYHFDNTHEEKEVQKKKDVKKKKKKKKFFTNAYGFSSSTENDDVDDENGSDQFFSSEVFFSSRSFSSDSSEFYKSSRKNKSNKKKKSKKHRSRKAAKVCDGFKPIVSVVEKEKSLDGIPVIKRSRDPYVDFRESMVEMIVERQIFGGKDLEKLLHSYLSLNSPLHHSVIIKAFADISEVLFCH